jgi:hypothetical protein
VQKNLRKHITKTLQAASTALEEIDSSLNYLRTLILLELAECDISEDLLKKAASHVDKAFHIDYISDQAKIDIYKLQRPLDRYLVPMKDHLELQTNIYKASETFVLTLSFLVTFSGQRTRPIY